MGFLEEALEGLIVDEARLLFLDDSSLLLLDDSSSLLILHSSVRLVFATLLLRRTKPRLQPSDKMGSNPENSQKSVAKTAAQTITCRRPVQRGGGMGVRVATATGTTAYYL